MDELLKTLIVRAGLTQTIIDAGDIDDDIVDIMSVLTEIHKGKSVGYGNYLETHGSDPRNFNLTQHFCDIKRKYVRAENFIKHLGTPKECSLLELLDTYADMAVYSALGIQLIDHLIKREEAGKLPPYDPMESVTFNPADLVNKVEMAEDTPIEKEDDFETAGLKDDDVIIRNAEGKVVASGVFTEPEDEPAICFNVFRSGDIGSRDLIVKNPRNNSAIIFKGDSKTSKILHGLMNMETLV